MDQSREILLGHAIFESIEYGYHGYRRIVRSISNKVLYSYGRSDDTGCALTRYGL